MAGTPHNAWVRCCSVGVSVHGPAIKVKRQPHILQHALPTQRAKRIRGHENDLRARASARQAVEENRNVGAEHVSAAFDYHGASGYRKAGVKPPLEYAIHVVAIGWVSGGQAEINAIESLRRPKIQIRGKLGEG